MRKKCILLAIRNFKTIKWCMARSKVCLFFTVNFNFYKQQVENSMPMRNKIDSSVDIWSIDLFVCSEQSSVLIWMHRSMALRYCFRFLFHFFFLIFCIMPTKIVLPIWRKSNVQYYNENNAILKYIVESCVEWKSICCVAPAPFIW